MDFALAASWREGAAFIAFGRPAAHVSQTVVDREAAHKRAGAEDVIDVEAVEIEQNNTRPHLFGKVNMQRIAHSSTYIERYTPGREAGERPRLIHSQQTPGQLVDLVV